MNIKEKCESAVASLKTSLAELKKEATGDYENMIAEIKNSVIDEPMSEEKMQELQLNIERIACDVFKSYLPQITEKYYPAEVDHDFSYKNQLRFLRITKWVSDKEEKDIDKLKNIYNSLSTSNCRIALIFKRTRALCEIFIGVANSGENSDPDIVREYANRFKQAIGGNFSGSEVVDVTEQNFAGDTIDFSTFGITKKNSVAIITNVASEKSEDFNSQSIEKLLDGFIPQSESEEYTLLLICEPLSAERIEKERKLICDYYTALSPYISWQSNFSTSEVIGKVKSAAVGGSIGLGVPHVVNISGNVNINEGINTGYSSQKGFVLTHTLYEIKLILARLEEEIKRLEQCEALGLWRFAAYVLSDDYSMTNNVANMYKSLTQGEKSYIEKTAINIWGNANNKNKELIASLVSHLQQLSHSTFNINSNDENSCLPSNIYATSFVSGIEIAHALNMPKKSVSGLPVLECAEFGREVISYADVENKKQTSNSSEKIELGRIYHMHKKEGTPVWIDKNGLTSHTFITGSTGSGKSNTIYQIINKLCPEGKKDMHFLIVEPAKGEYKNVFGVRKDISVYGTNQYKTSLLRINLFSFPSDIHVLEHIDRMVEIFNACWPMYAAMPAILKEAVESIYINKGWNLTKSISSKNVFPTFFDLLNELPIVIKSSSYSSDTQSDYTGALVTRVKSLTNGINGQIFCSADELMDSELFDRNVLVDISRVGSMETKSLLMGIMIMKLQEYRMSCGGMNKGLEHITVLEEAHNLLRRTSTEQSQESSNLQGKAVEMIANAIAEMRTYGEGFIIADQSPGLMDMSVIRNTNTKIIMRLPDESDRKLVGKAAALNDNQIIELSKLKRGVAAVYQNDWINPVLCEIEEFIYDKNYEYNYNSPYVADSDFRQKYLVKLLNMSDDVELIAEEVDLTRKWIDSLNVSFSTKQKMSFVLDGKEVTEENRNAILYNVFDGKYLAVRFAKDADDVAITNIDNRIQTKFDLEEKVAQEIRKIIFNNIIAIKPDGDLCERIIRLGVLK